VACLNGEPGIYTARWATPDPGDPHRAYRRLLEKLQGRPFHDRIARFVCVIALKRPGEELQFVEGTLMGVVQEEPRGSNGFAYDPVFYLLDYDKTLAELPTEEKDRISHRARAVEAARPIIAGWFGAAPDS
jgi:XTP/dITP diphosphohydrolase